MANNGKKIDIKPDMPSREFDKGFDLSPFQNLRLSDLAILWYNIMAAFKEEDLDGWQDINKSYDRFKYTFDRKVNVSVADLESALWSSNMMAERGKFWHPEGKNIREFVKKLLRDDQQFDFYYHKIKYRPKEERE